MKTLNKKRIIPGQTIGIIGGGQLGRMMAVSAKQMGYKVAVLEPKKDSPCAQLADYEINAPYGDMNAVKKLADLSDVITYEFENVDHTALLWLEENAYVPQGSELIRITQDRGNEKKAITESGGSPAPYYLVNNEEDLKNAISKVGIPSVLKTCQGGYDGKGQQVIKHKDDVEAAKALLTNGQCVLEKWIPFKKEISVIVSRSVSGEMTTLPVGENIHINNILHQTIVPARISESLVLKAIKMAKDLAVSINMIGTLAVEMFLTDDDEIYINELAPRPHNSGHYSMEACETSQFEQHIRAICDWPLGKTTLLKPVVMINILGQHVEPVLDEITNMVDCKLHLYGKDESKQDRKMGHINILAETVDEAINRSKTYSAWTTKQTS